MMFHRQLSTPVALLVVVLSGVLLSAACRLPQGGTAAAKRHDVQEMQDQALADLYRVKPEAKAFIESAEGYGVFSSLATKILLFGAGNGYGVIIDQKSGEKTYMRMAQGGVGIGMGIKDFRAIFVFTKRTPMRQFVDNGWSFKGDADAAAQYDEKGLGAGATANLGNGVYLYQLTKAGLALEAMVHGTKYWRYDELNGT